MKRKTYSSSIVKSFKNAKKYSVSPLSLNHRSKPYINVYAGTSTKAFLKGRETWNKETIEKMVHP